MEARYSVREVVRLEAYQVAGVGVVPDVLGGGGRHGQAGS